LEPTHVLLLSFWVDMKKLGSGTSGLQTAGQEGLFLKPFEPVIAGVFMNRGAVFLFDEA
jgi:hypothetical protein